MALHFIFAARLEFNADSDWNLEIRGSDVPSTKQLYLISPASAIIAGREGKNLTAVKEARDVTLEVARALDLSKTPEVKKPEGYDPDQELNKPDLNK